MIESLLSVWKTYPYLWGTLLLLGITFLGSRFFPNERRSLIWLSGLANIPPFIFVVFLEESYWAPARVGGYLLGLEDPLISFVMGAMAWFLAAWPHRHPLRLDQNSESFWRRYHRYGLPVAVIFLLLVGARLDPMTSLIVTLFLAWVVLLLLRPDLWTLSLSGFVLLPLGYYPCLKLLFGLWPDYLHQWNLEVFWGSLIGGVPLGELIWAAIFGACWPLFVGYVFQARFVAGRGAQATKRS